MKKDSFLTRLWDLWCIVSIVGIWPRFIEPFLIKTTKLKLKINHLPPDLEGFRILQFNDLHFSESFSQLFLDKIKNRITQLKPDLIVFVGDFINYSKLESEERLKQFLNSLQAPYGCYAVCGNHDYQQFVSVNQNGEYDLDSGATSKDSFGRAFKRLGSTVKLQGRATERALRIPLNDQLIEFLKKTPFKVLHNQSETIKVKNSFLNICGLGEYTLGRCLPAEAFKHYRREYPGVILSHNPDSISLLKDYPGEVILSGHTHGGQINLPWFWRKFTLLENMELKSGLKKMGDKHLYINRGIGSVLPFRWFAAPELTLITLER